MLRGELLSILILMSFTEFSNRKRRQPHQIALSNVQCKLSNSEIFLSVEDMSISCVNSWNMPYLNFI